MSKYLEEIAWNDEGLVAAVAIEAGSGQLLMQAWVNKDALTAAIDEGRAVYWSRSRNKLWRKGEESGNIQKLIDVYLDCDNDSLCYVVEQVGGSACHTGRKSCFHKKLKGKDWVIEGEIVTDPAIMYK